jgi:hypothetical protein
MNKNYLIKNDFHIPELINMVCPYCSTIIENCEICKEHFDDDIYCSVACRTENINNHKIHICSICFDNLPIKEQKDVK